MYMILPNKKQFNSEFKMWFPKWILTVNFKKERKKKKALNTNSNLILIFD